jgi:hypothetical protein
LSLVRQQHISQAPEQEESVRAEEVKEDSPVDPVSADADESGEMREECGDDDMNELVSAVRDEIEQLRGAGDGEEECAGPEDQNLEEGYADGQRCRIAQQLRVESSAQTGQKSRQQNVRYQRHGGDVHVGAVDVLARWEVEGGGRRCARGVGVVTRLTGPWAVPPRDEDDAEFGDNI